MIDGDAHGKVGRQRFGRLVQAELGQAKGSRDQVGFEREFIGGVVLLEVLAGLDRILLEDPRHHADGLGVLVEHLAGQDRIHIRQKHPVRLPGGRVFGIQPLEGHGPLQCVDQEIALHACSLGMGPLSRGVQRFQGGQVVCENQVGNRSPQIRAGGRWQRFELEQVKPPRPAQGDHAASQRSGDGSEL